MSNSRKSGSRRKLVVLAMAAAAAIAIASVPGFGSVDNEPTGATGTTGAGGVPGGSGGNGGDVNATASSGDTVNTATGTGGTGGRGGNGHAGTAPFGAGGIGGVGGNATGTENDSLTVAGTETATMMMTGGNGGNGGGGGGSGHSAQPGAQGGAGGTATISSTINAAGSDPINTNDWATGGNGGDGGRGGGTGNGGAGGNGGVATVNPITATSGSGDIKMEVVETGGNGGNGVGEAAGGAGASESLFNADTGSTSGTLNLGQFVIGGNGGGSGGGVAGASGNAQSIMQLNNVNPRTGVFNGESSAQGGSAQNSETTTGGTGGSGFSLASVHDTSNILLDSFATGGKGGSVDGGAVGAGGAGGSSEADVDGDGVGGSGHGALNLETRAIGGAGGSIINFVTGNGGAGGNSQSSAFGGNGSSENILISCLAAGGNGGDAQGIGFVGGSGGTGSITDIAGSSIDGAVNLTAEIDGGNGGAGFNGANGGNGASITMNNLMAGSSTQGDLILDQVAHGGNSGGSTGSDDGQISAGHAGIAGSASSTLTMTFSGFGPDYVNIKTEAYGGDAGAPQSATLGNGATSTALTNITANIPLLATATAGDSTIEFGTGSNGASPGRGGDSFATAIGTGTKNGVGISQVDVIANARGGPGGSAEPGATVNAGNAGDATASATANGLGPDPVTATANASGGMGGSTAGGGVFAGNGGNATSNATAVSTGGPAFAIANSIGTVGGNATDGASYGIQGGASAFSSATGIGQAQADSSAAGTSGSIGATSRANTTGMLSFIQATASEPVDPIGASSATAETLAISGSASPNPGVSSDFQALAYIVGSPVANDVDAVFITQPNVLAAMDNSPQSVFALGKTTLQYQPGGSGAIHTYSLDMDVDINAGALVANKSIIAGLVGVFKSGAGMGPNDLLRFRVERDSTTIVDKTFNDYNSLETYFNNAALDLGPEIDPATPGNLDLQFLFDFTSSANLGGIAPQFVLGVGSGHDRWTSGGGSWINPANWANSLHPDGPGATALIAPTGNTPQTVTLDEPTVLGSLTITQSAGYTIAPGSGGTLTLDNGGSPATLADTAGNQVISAPIILATGGVNASVAGGNTLTLSGGVSGNGAINNISPGTLILSAPGSYTGGTSVSSGIVTVATHGALSTGPVAISGTGKLNLNLGTGIAQMSSLSITGSGSMDITDNIAVVNSGVGSLSPTGNIGGYIKNGGIVSSKVASVNAAHGNPFLYAVGYADAADAAVAVDHFTPGTVVIEPALVGDANLDGKVNFTDFLLLASHFNAPSTSWDQGNFNYGATTNFGDFLLLAANFNNSTPLDNADFYEMNSFAKSYGDSLVANSDGVGFTIVPEPASLGILGFAGIGLLARRRHRRS